ncbi:hypothetical protein NDN08_006597 [Rhodosorus marinus]|uniref:Uncharacterized protein n=1 Tax=Rhodosorus marinus TaxID=101924 RepID=A0AAV8UI14_9RHOD|nr:hypothetical protein NDN08_006597 [Rhodosorus marinus]
MVEDGKGCAVEENGSDGLLLKKRGKKKAEMQDGVRAEEDFSEIVPVVSPEKESGQPWGASGVDSEKTSYTTRSGRRTSRSATAVKGVKENVELDSGEDDLEHSDFEADSADEEGNEEVVIGSGSDADDYTIKPNKKANTKQRKASSPAKRKRPEKKKEKEESATAAPTLNSVRKQGLKTSKGKGSNGVGLNGQTRRGGLGSKDTDKVFEPLQIGPDQPRLRIGLSKRARLEPLHGSRH